MKIGDIGTITRATVFPQSLGQKVEIVGAAQDGEPGVWMIRFVDEQDWLPENTGIECPEAFISVECQ